MPRSASARARAILPPYVLAAIARNGTPAQRACAARTIAIDGTLRALRAARVRAAVPWHAAWLAAEVQARRTVSDAHGTQTLPGDPVRTEGQPSTGDPAADEAYDGLGSTHGFFWRVFRRNSIDDEGMPLDATVHFGRDYANAFWDGRRMVFGDGDGDLFNRFTIALDVIGHELSHGVIADEAQLAYVSQAGALNESLADVFGSLVKQWSLDQTAEQADWLIGAGLFTPQVRGVALRSMRAPGTAFDDEVLGRDPQPAHMRDYVYTYEDYGGVHINSGIPNRAFYLAASALGGHAWERAGRIWYDALRDERLRADSGFQRFAGLALANARRLFGQTGPEQEAVRAAWSEVGIDVA